MMPFQLASSRFSSAQAKISRHFNFHRYPAACSGEGPRVQIDENALTHSRRCRLARHASQQNDDVPLATRRSNLQWMSTLEVQRRGCICCGAGPLKPSAYRHWYSKTNQKECANCLVPANQKHQSHQSHPLQGSSPVGAPPCLAQFPPPDSSGSLSSGHHTTGLHHHHTPATRLDTCKSLRRGTISLDEPARPSFRTASSTSFGLPVLSPSLLPIHSSNRISEFQTTNPSPCVRLSVSTVWALRDPF